MRPDKYKQAQARKYQAKLRSRDSEASKEIQEKRRGRNLKSRGGFQNKSGDKEHEETEEISEENDNSHRYKDISDTEDGIDSGTDDSEIRSYGPSTYFQFKEEKDWDTSVDASMNEDEIYQNLMNIRFDDLELSLSNVSLAERLDLNDDIFTEVQEINIGSSLCTTDPIVPKTMRSIPIVSRKFKSKSIKSVEKPTSVQSSTSNNITKEPQSKKTIEINLGKKVVANHSSQVSISMNKKPIPHSLINNKDDDDDIDDFLKSLDEENVKQIKPTSSFPNNKRGTKPKISISLKNQNKITAGKNDNTEDWLDDILK
ncbi:hypothetical protein GLOIN_2v1585583 [Rhizophagus clarus]|uniref:Uncharacterized protein n=1 Tax=Rhizophagus clarus TaxID=94130 RepID=A0A8H3KQT8_9GLOM|nr:hypothetical protein GLOIN_2v1585583 [Rhizophagus clarus]